MVLDTQGIAHSIAPHNLLVAASWFFPEHLLGVLNSPKRVFTRVPVEHCALGQVCFVSEMAPTDREPTEFVRKMSATTVGLDETTHLLKQIDYNIRSEANRPNDSALIQVTYDDYKLVDGHQVPFHIQQYLNGTLRLDVTLTAVELNAATTPSDFKLN